MNMIVKDMLPVGKQNAVNSKQLCDWLGFKSTRDLQSEIARERAAGAVILSTCQDDGGYYLPASAAEVKEFIHTLENRGKNTLLAIKSARKLLREWEPDGEKGGKT